MDTVQVQATPDQIQSWLVSATSGTPAHPAYYGMLMLGMASQAYTDDGNVLTKQTVVEALQTAIETPSITPPPPAASGGVVAGSWRLDWAANSSDNANLVYIASFRAQNNPIYPDGAPYFYVVGIRGTDTSTGTTALLQQIFQDCQNFITADWSTVLDGSWKDPLSKLVQQVPLLPGKNDASQFKGQNVVGGTARGFRKIANLLSPALANPPSYWSSGTPVLLALQQLILHDPTPKNCPTPIVVTGHSLGAAQTQVMASYLQWQFAPSQVIPYCYAPPTAGDSNFIAYLTGTQCPGLQFYFNTADIVPFAYIEWQDKLGLLWAENELWQKYNWQPTGFPSGLAPIEGPPLPSILTTLINELNPAVNMMSRPPSTMQFPLTLSVPSMPGQKPLPTFAQVLSISEVMKLPTTTASVTGGVAQLIWQHFPPCYQGLIAATYDPSVVGPYNWVAYPPPPPMGR